MSTASGIRAGRAFVELDTNSAKLNAGLTAAQARVKAFADQISSVGLGMAGIGGAVVAPIVASVSSFVGLGDQLDKMSKRTGVSVEALSEMRYAAKLSGSEIGDIETAIRKMQKTLTDAASGEKASADAFDAIGVSVKSLSGLKPEEQFEKISAAIAGIQDPTKRAAAAVDIFGRSGTMMLPMISDFGKLRAEAKSLGVTMSTDAAAKAAELGDAMDRVKMSLGAVAVEIGNAVAPALTSFSNWLAYSMKTAKEFAKEHETLIQVVGGFGVSLLGVGTALTIVSKAVSFSLSGWGKLVTAITTTKDAAIALKSVDLLTTMTQWTFAVQGCAAAMLGLKTAGVAAAGAAGYFVGNWLSKITGVEELGNKIGEAFNENQNYKNALPMDPGAQRYYNELANSIGLTRHEMAQLLKIAESGKGSSFEGIGISYHNQETTQKFLGLLEQVREKYGAITTTAMRQFVNASKEAADAQDEIARKAKKAADDSATAYQNMSGELVKIRDAMGLSGTAETNRRIGELSGLRGMKEEMTASSDPAQRIKDEAAALRQSVALWEDRAKLAAEKTTGKDREEAMAHIAAEKAAAEKIVNDYEAYKLAQLNSEKQKEIAARVADVSKELQSINDQEIQTNGTLAERLALMDKIAERRKEAAKSPEEKAQIDALTARQKELEIQRSQKSIMDDYKSQARSIVEEQVKATPGIEDDIKLLELKKKAALDANLKAHPGYDPETVEKWEKGRILIEDVFAARIEEVKKSAEYQPIESAVGGFSSEALDRMGFGSQIQKNIERNTKEMTDAVKKLYQAVISGDVGGLFS